MKTSVAVLLVVSAITLQAKATVISQWTFETSVPTSEGPLSPEIGSGTASASIGGTVSNPVGNGSNESWSSTGWNTGDYWQFQVSTLAFQNITVSWDQTSSGSGPKDFQFSYSTDGSSFTDFQTYSVLINDTVANGGAGAWSSITYRSAYSYFMDLSAVLPNNNAITLYLRLTDSSTTSANGGTVVSSGTDRIDNFTVSGTTIPTRVPDSSPALAGLACLVGMFAFARCTKCNC